MEPIKILILEDNAAAMRLWQLLLDHQAIDGAVFHTEPARDLAEAIEKLSAGTYDVILTDLMLPDSKGIETFREICKASKGAAVVVMTGLDDIDLALQMAGEGAEDYIVKGSMDTRALATRIRFTVMRYRRQLSGGSRCDG